MHRHPNLYRDDTLRLEMPPHCDRQLVYALLNDPSRVVPLSEVLAKLPAGEEDDFLDLTEDDLHLADDDYSGARDEDDEHDEKEEDDDAQEEQEDDDDDDYDAASSIGAYDDLFFRAWECALATYERLLTTGYGEKKTSDEWSTDTRRQCDREHALPAAEMLQRRCDGLSTAFHLAASKLWNVPFAWSVDALSNGGVPCRDEPVADPDTVFDAIHTCPLYGEDDDNDARENARASCGGDAGRKRSKGVARRCCMASVYTALSLVACEVRFREMERAVSEAMREEQCSTAAAAAKDNDDATRAQMRRVEAIRSAWLESRVAAIVLDVRNPWRTESAQFRGLVEQRYDSRSSRSQVNVVADLADCIACEDEQRRRTFARRLYLEHTADTAQRVAKAAKRAAAYAAGAEIEVESDDDDDDDDEEEEDDDDQEEEEEEEEERGVARYRARHLSQLSEEALEFLADVGDVPFEVRHRRTGTSSTTTTTTTARARVAQSASASSRTSATVVVKRGGGAASAFATGAPVAVVDPERWKREMRILCLLGGSNEGELVDWRLVEPRRRACTAEPTSSEQQRRQRRRGGCRRRRHRRSDAQAAVAPRRQRRRLLHRYDIGGGDGGRRRSGRRSGRGGRGDDLDDPIYTLRVPHLAWGGSAIAWRENCCKVD